MANGQILPPSLILTTMIVYVVSYHTIDIIQYACAESFAPGQFIGNSTTGTLSNGNSCLVSNQKERKEHTLQTEAFLTWILGLDWFDFFDTANRDILPASRFKFQWAHQHAKEKALAGKRQLVLESRIILVSETGVRET